MIKNLVFDLGNVLVTFRPEKYLKSLGIHESEVERLIDIIFKDKRWNEFDRGSLTIEQYVSELKAEQPQYSKYFDDIFGEDWEKKFFKLKEETAFFLQECSEKYNIYILSNVSEYVLNYIKTLDFFKYVTSGTYSYMVKSCKPEEEIYVAFFNDNGLIPEECLFLDDLPQNIETARKFKMQGIVFKDVADVRKNINI